MIEGAHEIVGRVNKGSVKIKYKERFGHGTAYSATRFYKSANCIKFEVISQLTYRKPLLAWLHKVFSRA